MSLSRYGEYLRTLLAGALALALVAPGAGFAEDVVVAAAPDSRVRPTTTSTPSSSDKSVLSWETGAGRSYVIPGIEINTDVSGVVRPLEQRIHLQGVKILVLGAGGAARAAVFGLKERGAEVYILNRTPGPAQTLAKQARAKAINKSQLKKLEFEVIINATPAGMEGNRDPLPISEQEFKAKYFFEMVYSPAETKMVKMARSLGMQVILGSEMFVQQGARQFEIWSAKPAPVEEMQRVVEYALAQRAAAKNGAKKNGK